MLFNKLLFEYNFIIQFVQDLSYFCHGKSQNEN